MFVGDGAQLRGDVREEGVSLTSATSEKRREKWCERV